MQNRILAGLVAAVVITDGAAAGPLEDAYAAYQRDCAMALLAANVASPAAHAILRSGAVDRVGSLGTMNLMGALS